MVKNPEGIEFKNMKNRSKLFDAEPDLKKNYHIKPEQVNLKFEPKYQNSNDIDSDESIDLSDAEN